MTEARAAADYPAWFGRFATPSGAPPMRPREWQEELARDDVPRSRVIRRQWRARSVEFDQLDRRIAAQPRAGDGGGRGG